MPSLGADMEDGTLVEWMIAQGDLVSRGDVVAVVETQKGAIEIECFEAGEVSELLASVGQVVPVGAPLALIGAGDAPKPELVAAPVPRAAPKPPDVSPPPAPDVRVVGAVSPIPGPSLAEETRATPAARARASELTIDLDGIKGTGPDGVIVLGDIDRARETEGAAARPTPSPPTDPKAEMRKAIAAAIARSKRTIPHFYLSQTIDIQSAMNRLADLNAKRAPTDRLLFGAMVLRAAALAARACPTLNGHYEGDIFRPAPEVHAGLAIALRGGGLVAPAVMRADALGLDETMAAMRDLVSRARAGRLRGSEMTAGTITVSSLGDSGAEAMGGVIFPPQVALVGVGAPQVRPWVVDGQVEPRHVITVTLAADHRVNDGRQASRFLAAFETHLTSPECP